MLVSTGELNRAVGGLPVMPEINMEVALQPRMIQFSLAPAYQPSRTPAGTGVLCMPTVFVDNLTPIWNYLIS